MAGSHLLLHGHPNATHRVVASSSTAARLPTPPPFASKEPILVYLRSSNRKRIHADEIFLLVVDLQTSHSAVVRPPYPVSEKASGPPKLQVLSMSLQNTFHPIIACQKLCHKSLPSVDRLGACVGQVLTR